MRGVCGPDYRAPLEAALPGATEQAVADADTFFAQELPAVIEWPFDADAAARVTQPALAVLGERSIPVFRERRDLLLGWLPNAEPFELRGRHAPAPGRAAARARGGAGGLLRPPSGPLRPRGVPSEFGTPGPPQVETWASRTSAWPREY